MTDELTRLRSIIRDAQHADTLDRTRAILETALAPQPKAPREYAEAQTLADLTPDAWRIVGRHGVWDDFPRWVIPLDEIKTFHHLRDEGLISSALKRVGEDQLILARQLKHVPDARPMLRRATLAIALLIAVLPIHARAADQQPPGHDTCQTRSCAGHGQFTPPRNGRWR